MKVTQEADYAIRVCCALDEAGGLLDAESIAESAVITKSIALKVLKKLRDAEIVSSQKGAVGGYTLAMPAEAISVYRIIEAIEGGVSISKCLSDDRLCSKNGSCKSRCKMHIAFDTINQGLVKRLESVTVRSITSPEVTPLEIKEKLK